MNHLNDILFLLLVLVSVVCFVYVLRWRQRTQKTETRLLAVDNVCDHLRPALDLLLSRGHQITRVGQNHPDLPLEIHLRPSFDAKSIYEELNLADPVFLSDRNVLYCKEDWCELHPKK